MVRRWNGWGDDAIEFALNEDALTFLRERIGPGVQPADASFEQVCRGIPPARLKPHPLINMSPQVRLRNGLGQSMQDWLRLRYGVPGLLPDGVAFPESSDQVRELLSGRPAGTCISSTTTASRRRTRVGSPSRTV